MLQYADRAFIRVNGTEIANLQSFSLKQNRNAKEVSSMTRNRRNRGAVIGNLTVDISLSIANENTSPRPKLEAIDYENNSVQIGVEIGGNLYTVKDIFLKDSDDNAGGVGDEVKTSFNYGALDVVDAAGNPVNFDIALG